MNPLLLLYISLPAFALGFILGYFCRSLNRAQKRAGYPPGLAIRSADMAPLQAAQERLNRAAKATDGLAVPRHGKGSPESMRLAREHMTKSHLNHLAMVELMQKNIETAAFRRAADERAVRGEERQ